MLESKSGLSRQSAGHGTSRIHGGQVAKRARPRLAVETASSVLSKYSVLRDQSKIRLGSDRDLLLGLATVPRSYTDGTKSCMTQAGGNGFVLAKSGIHDV